MKRTKISSLEKTQKTENNSISDQISIRGFRFKNELLILLGIICLFLIVGSQHLGKFFTTDETAWFYDWINSYWSAVLSFNFSQIPDTTYPGSLHSFLSGLTNLFLNQRDFLFYDKIETYLFWWRFPILLFNALSLIPIYFLLKHFFNATQSLLTISFIAFTPVIFGMSRIVNSDSVLWNTSLISVLSFIIFTEKKSKKHLILSGIFMGLALASKYNAVIIFIYQLVSIMILYFFNKIDKQDIKKLLISSLLIWLIAISIFSVFYPAVIVQPKLYWFRIFRNIIPNPAFILLVLFLFADGFIFKNKIIEFIKVKFSIKFILIKVLPAIFILSVFIASYIKLNHLDLLWWPEKTEQWKIPFPKSVINNLYGFFYSIQFHSILGILILGIISMFKKYKENDFSIPVLMLIYIVLFIIGASIQGVETGHRYIIMLLPFVSIIMVWVFSQLKKASIYLYFFAILISITDISMLYPNYYFLYRSTSVFSGHQKYMWSLGAYEMAQKLNDLPGAEKLSVLSDRQGFPIFFKGKSTLVGGMLTSEEIKKYDYLYLSSAGYEANYITQPLEYYYDNAKDSSLFYLGNENIAWVSVMKVNKNKKSLQIENTYDTKFYFDLERDWTLSFWIEKFETNPGKIFYIGRDCKNGVEFYIENNDFKVKYSDTKIIKINNLDKNSKNNIVWAHKNIYNKQITSLWLNGNKIDETDITNLKTQKPKFLIATDFKGFVNDVRIFNFAINKKKAKIIFEKGEGANDLYKSNDGEFSHVKKFQKEI